MIFFASIVYKGSLTYIRDKETIWVKCYSHGGLSSLAKSKLIVHNL